MSKSNFSVRYELTVRSSKGEIKDRREGHNLVMRSSIASFFNQVSPIADFKCGVGTTNPNTRDSGVVTFTNNWVSAGTSFQVTASAGFFVSGDAGRLLKLDTGEEMVISGFTSSTVVTVTGYPVAPTAAQLGTVWYDNATALDSVSSVFNTAFGAATTNVAVVTGASGTVNATVVRQCTTGLSNGAYTITELGWFSGATMIGRVYLTSPFSMALNDYIECTVTVNYAVNTATQPVSLVGTYADFSGNSRFYGIASNQFTKICFNFSSGANTSPLMSRWSSAVSLANINNTAPSGPTSQVSATVTVPASPYPSTYYSLWTGTFTGAMTIASLGVGTQANGSGDSPWVHTLTAPVTLVTLQSATVAFQFSMTRTLVN
jgi:hypothetical protein